MKARLREILRCPACRGPLGDAADALRCAPCRTEYPVVQGVPIFIPADQLKTVDNLPARSGYDPWLHYFTMSSLRRSALILDIGAGDMGLDHPNIVRLDVFLSPHCDVVADAHHLPFTDDAFEFVFSLAVLEHLRQPFTAADEMYRILRPGGYVYCDTNFVFPYHGFPHHYFNYSIHGIEQVFRQFHKLRACVPPYQMPSFAIESLLGTYLACFQPVTEAERQAVASARALLALPWREFDQHFPPERAYTCSAGVCFYGMKGAEAVCIPEPVRRAWVGRADLRQTFPVPEDLSTAPNLVSWFAEAGRGQNPEVDACLDEDPLIPAASLNLAAPSSAPTPSPPPSRLRRASRVLRGAVRGLLGSRENKSGPVTGKGTHAMAAGMLRALFNDVRSSVERHRPAILFDTTVAATGLRGRARSEIPTAVPTPASGAAPASPMIEQETYERLYDRVGHAFLPAESVGDGDYDLIGRIEVGILLMEGLRETHTVVDFGCGTGRLAVQLVPFLGPTGKYLGTDIARSMLRHAGQLIAAKVGTPRCSVEFRHQTTPEFGLDPDSVDFVCAFSVFTHMEHEDAYRYLAAARRIVPLGGKFIFSCLPLEELLAREVFLGSAAKDLAARWAEVRNVTTSSAFMEAVARLAGWEPLRWYAGNEPNIETPGETQKQGLGQATCVLVRKE